MLGLSEVGRKERFSEKYLKVYGEDEMPPERVFAFLCAALATFGRHRGLLITYYYYVRLTTHYLLLTTYGSLPTVHYLQFTMAILTTGTVATPLRIVAAAAPGLSSNGSRRRSRRRRYPNPNL